MTGKVLLHIPQRKSLAGRVPNAVLCWNDLTMILDTDELPPKLSRLLPNAYAHAKDAEWYPFITLAIAMRLMS